jgi:uncharacterized RDD family membrane protein YckC
MSIAARRPRLGTAPTAAPAALARDDALAAPAPRHYVGLVTRALAFAVDAVIIDAVAIGVAAVVTVTLSVVTVPDQLRVAAAGAAGVLFVLWAAAYFVTFWATTGQTPGSRLLRIRVRATSGGRLPPRRALVRFVGLTLAAIPLGAGYLMILVDDRCRGLHDRLARTVVVEAGGAAADDHPDRMRRAGPG